MIPVMIPVGRVYRHENDNAVLPDFGELRYALRSLHQHGRNVGRVTLVFGSEKYPTWLDRSKVGIRLHADIQDPAFKERNIYLKVLGHFEYAPAFLFMNDDHFLLKDHDLKRFPNYCDKRTVGEVAQALRGRGDYAKTLNNTVELLGAQAKYFDVHAPILVRTYPWLTAFRKVPTSKAYGFCLKSVYGNLSKLTATAIEDCKITGVETAERIRERIAGRPMFSTGDHAFGRGMLEVLEELYPNPSPYELR